MPRPRPRLAALAALATAGSLALPAARAGEAFDPFRSDPAAVALADRVMEALGGREAWEATRFLRFTFAGRRTHYWDRATGRHRLEGTTPEGETYVVLHDLHRRQGRAWVDGARAADEAELLERAYGAWINDTYWLLAPYKMKDPGVILRYRGEEELGGVAYAKVELSFDGVGLTPGDRYWMYINPETGLVERWAYVLEGQEGPPTHWVWKDWQRYGGILLSPLRVDPETGRELRLSEIAVFDRLPNTVFASPAPVN